jgi:hypothetical protein
MLLGNTAFIAFFERGGSTARTSYRFAVRALAPLLDLEAFIVRHAVLYLFICTAAQRDFGRSKGFVRDFVRSACDFWLDVFGACHPLRTRVETRRTQERTSRKPRSLIQSDGLP